MGTWQTSVNAILALYSSIGGTTVLQVREPTLLQQYENHVMLFSMPCARNGSCNEEALAIELRRFGEVSLINLKHGQLDGGKWQAQAHVAFTSAEAAAACVTQLTREGFEAVPYRKRVPYNERGWVCTSPCLNCSARGLPSLPGCGWFELALCAVHPGRGGGDDCHGSAARSRRTTLPACAVRAPDTIPRQSDRARLRDRDDARSARTTTGVALPTRGRPGKGTLDLPDGQKCCHRASLRL